MNRRPPRRHAAWSRKPAPPPRAARSGLALAASALAVALLITPSVTWATGDDGGEVVEEVDSATPDPVLSPENEDDIASEAELDVGSPADDLAQSGDEQPEPAGEEDPDSGAHDLEKAPPAAPAPPPPAPEGSGEPEEGEEGDVPPFQTFSNGVDSPYLEWTVEDEYGQLVGGASFNVQGPAVRTSGFWSGNFGWGSTYTVEDCTSEDCSGFLDKDPEPGKFKVPALGGDDIRNDRRYRIRHDSAPTDYNFLASRTWDEIPGNQGSGNGNSLRQPTPTPNPFGETWDFEAFKVSQTPYAPRCEPGYSYGVSRNGYILEVDHADGSVNTLGNQGSSVFNGLGIGMNGEAYAYTGSGDSSITIYKYNPGNGNWTTTNRSINSSNQSRTVNFVAGAVDLSDGKFYVGGYNNNGDRFRIWQYDPASNSTSYIGSISTPYHSSEGTQANGDMAFDDEGNLYIVRGTYTGTSSNPTGWARIFSVDASDFANASGGTIPSSGLSAFKTPGMTNVNGIAFDADGGLLLSNAENVWSFDMPNFTNATEITDELYQGPSYSKSTSTDLATCASPPRLTIKKFIDGGRVKNSDQFTMTLTLGNEEIGATTTTGDVDGYQLEQIGPAPVVRGVALTFTETAGNSSTNLDEYTTRYSCTVDGQDYPAASGSGTQGSITLPQGSENAVCEFHNSPLVADVVVSKNMLNVDGSGPATQEEGWTVGLDLVSPPAGATLSPSAAQQQTDEDGVAAWKVLFSDKDHSTSVKVSEEMQQGFEFADASCTVTHIDGSTSDPMTLSGPEGTVDGIVPGDQLFCEFTNKPIEAELDVTKKWMIGEASYAHGDQPDWLGAQLSIDGEDESWGSQEGPFAANQDVEIAESVSLGDDAPAGCAISDTTPTINGSNLEDGSTTVTLQEGSNEFTITNYVDCEQSLTLLKDVDNDYDGEFSFDIEGWPLDSGAWDEGLFVDGNVYDPDETQIDPGEYTLTEANIDGYVHADEDHLVCDGGTLDGNTVTVDIGEDVTCTFTNVIKPGSVRWTKVDENDSPLTGSEWTLEGPNGIDETELTGDDGEFSFEGLPWGEYTLTETKPPAGYKITEGAEITFTIGLDDPDAEIQLAWDHGKIKNEMRDVPDLPLTGGIGRDHIYIAGALTALLGMAAYFVNRRRQA